MARDQIDMTPIETRDELVAWLEAGCKPKARWRVGTEHEKFAFRLSDLRPLLPTDFVSDASRFILAHPGRALIVTGFLIPHAGAPETDGPPGAAALHTVTFRRYAV